MTTYLRQKESERAGGGVEREYSLLFSRAPRSYTQHLAVNERMAEEDDDDDDDCVVVVVVLVLVLVAAVWLANCGKALP